MTPKRSPNKQSASNSSDSSDSELLRIPLEVSNPKKKQKVRTENLQGELMWTPENIQQLSSKSTVKNLKKILMEEIITLCSSMPDLFDNIPKTYKGKEYLVLFISHDDNYQNILDKIVPLLKLDSVKTSPNKTAPLKVPKSRTDPHDKLLKQYSLEMHWIEPPTKVAVFAKPADKIIHIGNGIFSDKDEAGQALVDLDEIMVTSEGYELGEAYPFPCTMVCGYSFFDPKLLTFEEVKASKTSTNKPITLASIDRHMNITTANLEKQVHELQQALEEKTRLCSKQQEEIVQLHNHLKQAIKTECIPQSSTDISDSNYRLMTSRAYEEIELLLQPIYTIVERLKKTKTTVPISWKGAVKYISIKKAYDLDKKQANIAVFSLINILIDTFDILDRGTKYKMPKDTTDSAGTKTKLPQDTIDSIIESIRASCLGIKDRDSKTLKLSIADAIKRLNEQSKMEDVE